MVGDTTPEVANKMRELIAALTPEQRLEKGARLFASGRRFAEIVVLRRDGSLKGLNLKIAAFRWMYRTELSEKVMDSIEQHVRRNAAEDERQVHT